MSKFSACPICNKTQVKVLREKSFFEPHFYVKCSVCGCESEPCGSKEEAVSNWNYLSKQNKDTEERYYSSSLLRDLAFNDTVNGKCDGTIDYTVVHSLSGAKVKKEVTAEWTDISVYDDISEFGSCITRTFQICSHCSTRTGFDGRKEEIHDDFCPACGAQMIKKED